MFEPIHGSAFDITGKGIANPIATFWTASMMLDHLGEKEAAARLLNAVEKVTAKKIHTPDLGGEATTAIVTAAVLRRAVTSAWLPRSSPGRFRSTRSRACRRPPRADGGCCRIPRIFALSA
jgi:hypothetical protein